jgi:hypothetical protein
MYRLLAGQEGGKSNLGTGKQFTERKQGNKLMQEGEVNDENKMETDYNKNGCICIGDGGRTWNSLCSPSQKC